MADDQRVHPVQDSDAAAVRPQSSTTPLVGRGSVRSENGDPERQYPYKRPRKRGSCFKKCCCCTISLLLLLLLVLGILAAVIYFVFEPKVPEYSVNSLRITHLNLTTDNSLSASFNVAITTKNPNEKIGIYYVSGSHLSVWYRGTKLCEGSLPEFYQGHRNTTSLRLTLSGETRDAIGLLQSLVVEQQSGSIPLILRAKVPVRLKLGRLKLMKWEFLVRCKIVVDSLKEGDDITVRDSSCQFRFRL